jgi:hypothetical protein
MLTIPNMVLTIPVWYLHPLTMVPQSYLPPKSEGIAMQIPVLTPTKPPSPPRAGTTATSGGRWKNKEPTVPPKLNLLAHYAKERETPLINVLLLFSYTI